MRRVPLPFWLGLVLLAMASIAPQSVCAQRIQFGNRVVDVPKITGAGTTSPAAVPASATTAYSAPTNAAPLNAAPASSSNWDPYSTGGNPNLLAPAGGYFTPQAPTYTGPASSSYQPAGAYPPASISAGSVASPGSSLYPDSSTYPAAGTAPVYPATPFGSAPVVPNAPAFPVGPAYTSTAAPFDRGPLVPRPRRLEQISFSHTFLPDLGNDGVVVQDFDVNGAFKFGALNPDQPLYITPGFTLNLFTGPPNYPLGSHTYDVYVNFAWRPHITERFALDLGFTPSLSTDFKNTTSDMFRFQGKILGVATATPEMQFAFGLYYVDRVKTQFVPAIGVILTPNPDVRYEIFFPRPKFAHRLQTGGNTDMWWYVGGEYGGGSWAIERQDGVNDRFDYNDIRVVLGLEWQRFQGHRGSVELGYAFNREFDFENYPDFDPDDTLMLRCSFAY